MLEMRPMTPSFPIRSVRRGVRGLACASLSVLLGLPGCASRSGWPWPAAQGRVHGTLRVVNQQAAGPIGPAVVYLEPAAGRAALPWEQPPPARIRHDGARFSPALVAIGPGQALEIANASGVLHRVFWLREGARSDLELPPEPGAVETVELARPGIVRFYCDLHSEEHFAVHLAPTPHFALLERPGPFAFEDVPAGPWRLAIWSEAVAGRIRDLTLAARDDAEHDVWIDALRAQQVRR